MDRIEEKYGLKTGHAIALFIIFVLNILWLICNFINISEAMIPQFIISIVLCAAAVMYACYGYKKPHSNHMRYLLLINAVFVAWLLVLGAKVQPTYMIVSYLVGIISITYMAGRLDHYKQNLVICAVVLVCNVINACFLLTLTDTLTFTYIVASFGSVTVWLAVAGGYITRFKLHKEAGMLDK